MACEPAISREEFAQRRAESRRVVLGVAILTAIVAFYILDRLVRGTFS